jgi:hypothetical protein
MLFLMAAVFAMSTVMGNCRPVAGEAELWANPQTRYIMVGVIHGTAETPALFGDIACAAHASGRPVVVALELADWGQPALDVFLNSNGGEAARRVFLQSPLWRLPMKDGRSSQAYLGLIERLRLLKQAGAIEGVVAIKPTGVGLRDDENAAMADDIRAAARQAPRAIVLVLVGSVHASKLPISFGDAAITPAAADLPPAETLSLLVLMTGRAWNCTSATECADHRQEGVDPVKRGVSLAVQTGGQYDGAIDLGVPATASPPAVR